MRARRRTSLLAGAGWGCLVAVVSAVAVVLGVLVQDAVVRAVGSGHGGPVAGVVFLTLVVAAVGAAAVGAVVGALAALVVRRPGLSDARARAAVVVLPVVVVAAVVAAITQGAAYSVWLWAMVPVSALAGLVLARRLVPRP